MAVSNGLLRAYNGASEPISAETLKLTNEKSEQLVSQGFLSTHKRDLYPGLLLNLAFKADPPTDLSYLLPMNQSDSLFRDIVHQCMRLTRAKTMPLLHAPYLTNHYFDTDRLVADYSTARQVVVNTFRTLLPLLKVDCLSCTISPEGLIGTYPLCFHLSLAANLRIVAALRRRLGGIEFVGGLRPQKGNVLIINDVLTTGTSILQMTEELRRLHLTVLGAFVLYDRQEGGKELLEQNAIPIVSLMSIQSIRNHCERIASGELPSRRLKRKAIEFLGVSHRLQFVSRSLNQAFNPSPRLGIASALAPGLEAFDSSLQFKPYYRKKQLRLIALTLRDAVRNHCSILAMPELTVPLDCRPLLARTTKQHPLIVVAGAEYNSLKQNIGLIAIDGKVFEQAKLVRSPYDLESMEAGDRITIFKQTSVGNFAVLVCADQVNYQAIDGLKGEIDLLVIVSRNRAIKTFASMAAGDAYRIYSFIVVANDRNCGDSIIASPEKGKGKVRWINTQSDRHVYYDLRIDRLRQRSEPFLQEIVYSSHAAEEKGR